jgi:hypothetical protein
VQPSHARPSTLQLVETLAQMPGVVDEAPEHTPVQQSTSLKQMSPVCVQYETSEGEAQIPLVHSFEQQSPLPFGQALPAVLHVVLSALHAPLAHSVLQHSGPPAVQAAPSDRHCVALQVPPKQSSVQQSVEATHELPAGMQLFAAVQWLVPSHSAEQHCEPVVQLPPNARQEPTDEPSRLALISWDRLWSPVSTLPS